MLARSLYCLVSVAVSLVLGTPVPMESIKAASKGKVQRVQSFEELVSTSHSNKQRQNVEMGALGHDYMKLYGHQSKKSLSDFADLSMYDVDYIKNLVDTGDIGGSEDILQDPYDTSADPYYYMPEYDQEDTTTTETGEQWHQGAESFSVMQDADGWPIISTHPHQPNGSSVGGQHVAPLQDILATVKKEDPDEEVYYTIYRQHSTCEDRTARTRLKAKLNDRLRSMLLSKDERVVSKACHILSCRNPNDLFNTEEAAILIGIMQQRVGVKRKLASSILRLGQHYFPSKDKRDLFGDDIDKFNDAFEVLYRGYMRKNAQRAREGRLKYPKRKTKDLILKRGDT